MKIKLILIVLAVFVVAVGSGMGFYISQNKDNKNELRLEKILKADSPVKEDQDIIRQPQLLEIPKIKVKTNIEYVGLLSDGSMGVPEAYANVAWYKDGYFPAEKGNAVISGHVDTPQGARAVFADLDQVEVGDFVIVWREEGMGSVIFKVYDKKVFPDSEFPLEEVFGKTNERNLNLITCTGQMVDGKYPDRLVIFARKV